MSSKKKEQFANSFRPVPTPSSPDPESLSVREAAEALGVLVHQLINGGGE